MKFIRFIFIGLFVALAGEYQINILIQHKQLGAYLMTFVIYAFFIILFYNFGKFLDKKLKYNKADLIYYFTAGFVGLLIEWFLIGNTLSANSGANQAGMFAWWTAIFMVPRIFIKNPDHIIQKLKTKIYSILIPYSLFSTTLVALLPPNPEIFRILVMALSMIFTYILLNYYLVNYLIFQNLHLQKNLRYFYWFLVILAFVNLFFVK